MYTVRENYSNADLVTFTYVTDPPEFLRYDESGNSSAIFSFFYPTNFLEGPPQNDNSVRLFSEDNNGELAFQFHT